MNKTLKLVLCFLGVIVPVGSIFMIVDYQKDKINNSELVLYEEIEEEINFNLTSLETFIIFILSFIIVISLINIFFMIFNIIFTKKIWYHHFLLITMELILSSLITFIIYKYVGKNILVINNKNIVKPSEQSYIIKHVGQLEIDSDEDISYKNYSTIEDNTNTILIKGSSSVSLNGVMVNKYGDSTNILTSKIYGTNSGVLVLKDSTLNIKNSTINTSAKGGIGLFSTLENSSIKGDMLIINTSGSDSYGINSSLGGNIEVSNTKINTTSYNSPTISSLRSGVVTVTGSILSTNSQSSPLIYTSGTINLNDSVGDANSSGFAYIDGKSVVRINNSKLKAAAIKYSNKDLDAGFIIKDSLISKKFNESTLIEISNSDIEIKKQSKVFSKAPLFYINNSNVTLNLYNTEFIYGSNNLIVSKGNNKNIIVNVNCEKQVINGNIILDNKTTLNLNYKNTTYTGNINKNNSGKKVTLNMDSNSKLVLTDDSYIDVIIDEDNKYTNIDSNGYNIYYDSKLNEQLEGKKIELINGGYLLPR